MALLFLIIVFAFVVGVIALVGLALFEMSPFGRHSEYFRDPVTHARFEAPNLEDGH